MNPPSPAQTQALISNMTSDTTALASQLTNMAEDEALDIVSTFASAVQTPSTETASAEDGEEAVVDEQQVQQIQEVCMRGSVNWRHVFVC